MGNDSDLVHIIILALIALFIGLRLRSVLGSRTGTERPPRPPSWVSNSANPNEPKSGNPNANGPNANGPNANDPNANDNVIDLANRRGVWSSQGDSAQTSAQGLAAIAAQDPSFTTQSFLSGAQTAFGIIVEAFAAGDRAVLRPLVSEAVFNNFDHALGLREQAQAAGETWGRNRLAAIADASIVAATLQGAMAEITVRFSSTQLVSDIHGQETKDTQINLVDLWTFQRRLRTSDPTWALIATRAVEE